ncbi:hypothetical protein CR162_18400 [Pseudoroseomonas rhizosphaerae]|uniref:Conjugal transfer protein TraG n=1 Tax=Teichococcus rhizosphaerae TaxID=1335062 RepID=A0A2C7A8S8_9PROT|nr:type IV secretory system conjugative DNA transfer family protein [Pseudoroseomonas rhizosphaerae]PHK93446.1 hypothetical protein CR162_18400 [Pseudoroseomonas rhizosphaerae]
MTQLGARWAGLAVVFAILWAMVASLALIALLGMWQAAEALPPHYLPLQWFLIGWHYFDYYRVPQSLLISAAGASALIATLVWRSHQILTPKRKLHGETRWLTRKEGEADGLVWSKAPPGDAIVLGRDGQNLVSLPGQDHVALYARTGAGKGVGFVVPNCQNWGGSLVCFSVKRDVAQAAAAERQRLGDEVFLFDLMSHDGRTHRWNPLGQVRRGTPEAFNDIQKAMFRLVPETKAQNPFWDNAGRRLAGAAALLLAETPSEPLTVQAVRRLLARPDWAENFQAMLQRAREEGRPYPVAAVDTISAIIRRKEDESAASVIETTTTALALWEIPRVAAGTAESDFDLGAIRTRKMSIFVVASPDDIRRLRIIYQMFFSQFVAANTQQEFGEDPAHRHRVLVMLDEFWALGEVSVLADAVAFTRSYGFRLAYVIQSKNQTVTSFGKEGSKNLFLNTGAELLYGGCDIEVAEEASKRMGFDTVEEVTRSRPRYLAWFQSNKQTESEAMRRRALMLPQEISRMKRDQVVVLRPGIMPMRLQRIRWFEDQWFRDRGGSTPEWPNLEVAVERDTVEGGMIAQQP